MIRRRVMMTTETAASGGVGLGRGGRMSRKRKRDAVLRLLRGEDLETLSRALGATAATLTGWRDTFVAAGEASLATRSTAGEALEPIRQGVRRCFGGFAQGIGRGLAIRHDHGSQYLSNAGGFATAILVREDGAVLARYPALPIGEHGPPRLASSSGFMQALRANQERGFYTTISFFDGVERTLTYARLPRHPVYVAVGFDTASVWQTWRAEVMGQLAFVVPATLALVLIALLALRRTQREIAAVQERRRAEAQMQELCAKLLHVSRLAAMGQMASVLAHELNQPLAAASNYLSAAKRLPVVDGSRATACVDKASQQILRAGEIIQRLRDFVSKGKLTRHVMDIGPVLEESVALALTDRSHRSITVVEHVDPGARFVRIDRVQIQQVLVNLIRNAAEAMEGSPRREITLATAPHEVGLIEVSVADTGFGMAADIAGRLFQPFVTAKPDGMGVGLSICRTIVEAHGGHIRAEANPEGGYSAPLHARGQVIDGRHLLDIH